MDTLKFRKVYLLINVPLITIGLVLMVTSFFLTDKAVVYHIGIICRIILGIWCVFNGIWNFSTNYYSFLRNKWIQTNRKAAKVGWMLLVIVGAGCLVTAYMGYGFNNVQKPI